MFEDKELLNIILFEKRFITYAVCVAMIIFGVILGQVKVSDDEIINVYNHTYPNIVWSDSAQLKDDIKIETSDNNNYAINTGDKKIIGIYIDDTYIKGDFQKNKKIKINTKGTVTGLAVEE